MRLIYISEGNLPSQEANSLQVANMAQALARRVQDFELVTLGDVQSWVLRKRFDFRRWYALRQDLRIVRLPIRLKPEYPLPANYRHLPFPLWAAIYGKLKAPELIYTRSREAAEVALDLGLAVILEWHTREGSDTFKHPAFRSRRLLGVVTTSRQVAEEYIAMGLSPQNVLIERNGVNLDDFLPDQSPQEARRRLGLPQDSPILVYAGHLHDYKGIPTLLELAELLPRCLFVLVGGWERDVERTRLACKSRGLSNVEVVGDVRPAQVPHYLSASDILILPNSARYPEAETTSPLKLSEYMAARRAIVASALPNVVAILEDGKNALLAQPDSTESFKVAIERLLTDAPLRRAIAEQAYQDVQYYTWDRRAERVLRFAVARLDEIDECSVDFRRWFIDRTWQKLKRMLRSHVRPRTTASP